MTRTGDASAASLPSINGDDPTAVSTPAILRDWPSRSASSVQPRVEVRVSSRQLSTSVRAAALADMFDSESSADEQAPKPQKRQLESQGKAHEIHGSLAFVAAVPVAQPQAVTMSMPVMGSAGSVAAPTPAKAGGEAPAVSLRDAYTLPKPGRKKKKKAAAQQQLNLGQAAGVKRSAAAAGLSFDAEAEQFRNALSGAFAAGAGAVASAGTPALAQGDTSVPRPKKKKKKIIRAAQPAVALETAVEDPYAIVDPYSFGSAPSSETPAANLATAGIAPKKKKKKKIVRPAAQAGLSAASGSGVPLVGADPYS